MVIIALPLLTAFRPLGVKATYVVLAEKTMYTAVCTGIIFLSMINNFESDVSEVWR